MGLLILSGIALAIVLTIAVIPSIGAARFRARYDAERAELIRCARASSPVAPCPEMLAGLPPPVRRYLKVTSALGAPRPRVVFLEQTGALRAAPDKPWLPFEAEQAYSLDPPGFIWLAKARIAPFVPLFARDRFAAGEGHMLVRMLGLLTVADRCGLAVGQGAALRYWGEVIAFPEAILSEHLRWKPIDERRARLVAEHDGLRLTATVEFDASGLPIAVHAERYRDVNGASVLTPWSGYSRDWKRIDGRLFPSRWESVWHLPGSDFLAVKIANHRIETA